jgi:hypothetical protein
MRAMPWSDEPDERATTIEQIGPGSVLDRAMAIYRAHFLEVYAVALIIGLIEAIISYALEDTDAMALAFGFSLLAATVLTGLIVTLVRDVQAGVADPSVGGLLREVLPALAPLLAVSLLAGIATFFGLILLIVPGLLLLTMWAVVGPVVVIERVRVMDAFGRSRELVRGNGWNVFALLLLTLLLVAVVTALAVLVTVSLDDALGRFIEVLLVALVSPIQALATAVLFFRLREAHGEPPVTPTPATGSAGSDAFGR